MLKQDHIYVNLTTNIEYYYEEVIFFGTDRFIPQNLNFFFIIILAPISTILV